MRRPEELRNEYERSIIQLSARLTDLRERADRGNSFANPQEFLQTAVRITQPLVEAYKVALQTTDPEDDVEVEDYISRIAYEMERVIDISPSLNGPEFKNFFSLWTYVVRQLEITPPTPIQVQSINSALLSMAEISNRVGDVDVQRLAADLNNRVRAAMPDFAGDPNRSRIEQGLKESSFVEALESIDLAQLHPEDQTRYRPLMARGGQIERAAARLSNVVGSPERALDPADAAALERILDDIHDSDVHYQATPAGRNELRKIELLVHQMLHENRVLGFGRRDAASREFLRPSLRDINDPDLQGTMQQFIGSFATDLDEAEVMGAKVADAIKNNQDPKAVLTESDRAQLRDLKRRISDYIEDQGALLAQADQVLGVGERDRLENFVQETQAYVIWLDRVLNATEPNPARAGAPEGVLVNSPDVENFMKLSFHDLVHNLITNEYKEDQFPAWDNVKNERLEALGIPEFKELIDLMRACHAFGIIKLDSFNLAYLTANRNDRLKGVLSNAEGIGFWDKFRGNAFYREIVEKVSDRADERMAEKGEWSAGLGWSNGWDLIQKSMDYVLTHNPGALAVLDRFPPDLREDIKKVFARLAHYDCSLRDRRQRRATEKLGLERAAFKHVAGSEVGVAGRLAQDSYKIGKNNDLGLYSSDLGWIEMPHELEHIPHVDPAATNDEQERQRKKIVEVTAQVKRFHNRSHTIEHFMRVTFDKMRIVSLLKEKKWKPRRAFPIPLFLDDFLTSPDRNYGIRAGDDNFNNFSQSDADLEAVYNKASSAWANPEMESFSKLNDEEFKNKIADNIGKIGTSMSKALSYNGCLTDPNIPAGLNEDQRKNFIKYSEARGEFFESMRAAAEFYIIYIYGQIKFDFNQKTPQTGYDTRYRIARAAMRDYFERNSSFDQDYRVPGTGEVRNLRSSILETIQDPRLQKSTNIVNAAILRTRRLEKYNAEEMRAISEVTTLGQRLSFDATVNLADLKHEPHWPFKQSSNTSSREEGEK